MRQVTGLDRPQGLEHRPDLAGAFPGLICPLQEAASYALDSAQEALDGAVRAFAMAGLADEPSAVEGLTALREARDEAQANLDQITPKRADLTITADQDWDRLSLSEKRDLVRALIKRVVIAPGRHRDRITVEYL